MTQLIGMTSLVGRLDHSGIWKGSTDDGALAYAAGVVQFKMLTSREEIDPVDLCVALGGAWIGFATILEDQGLPAEDWQSRAEILDAELSCMLPTLANFKPLDRALDKRVRQVSVMDTGSTPQLEVMCDQLVTYGWSRGIQLEDALGTAYDALKNTMEESILQPN